VSFGLFIPPRILNAAKYGGLNVHPSLLPDLRGPAPIHHTLLKKRRATGITVQTLHPKHFDKGMILAQTLPPGVSVMPTATVSLLTRELGILGGQLLLDVLQRRAFVPPLENVGWYPNSKDDPIEHAEKITPAHRMIDFSASTLDDILTRHRVLGDLWCSLPNGERIIFHEILDAGDSMGSFGSDGPPGVLVRENSKFLLARTMDMHLIMIPSSTVSGGKKGAGLAYVRRHYGETSHDGNYEG
jgi:methionyl-tRNA formyltransferase